VASARVPHVHVRIAKYCAFWYLLDVYPRYNPNERGGGGGVFKAGDVGQGSTVPKVSFWSGIFDG